MTTSPPRLTRLPSQRRITAMQSVAKFAFFAALAGLLLLSGACAGRSSQYQVADLYDTSQPAQGQNPVIIIPGFFGTRLVDDATGDVLWGTVGTGTIRPSTPVGARRSALPIELPAGHTLTQAGPSGGSETDSPNAEPARPDGILDAVTVRLLGLHIEVDVYRALLDAFGRSNGNADDACGASDRSCYVFPYDWRRDNVENARRLEAFIEQTRTDLLGAGTKTSSDNEFRFDLVAHSMGGVLARYFLRYGGAELPTDGSLPELTWSGARHIERAILVAPPNFGTLGTLNQLVNGRDFPPGVADYPPAILGTFPAAYQLLPRARHAAVVLTSEPDEAVDLFDATLWQRLEWGLADPSQAEVLAWLLPGIDDPESRRRIALEHQQRLLDRARAFTEALDRPARPPAGLSLYLATGDSVATVSRVSVDPGTGELGILAQEPGDGTVLRSSALATESGKPEADPTRNGPIEWRSTLFLSAGHLGITKDRDFADNALYWLREAPRAPVRP